MEGKENQYLNSERFQSMHRSPNQNQYILGLKMVLKGKIVISMKLHKVILSYEESFNTF